MKQLLSLTLLLLCAKPVLSVEELSYSFPSYKEVQNSCIKSDRIETQNYPEAGEIACCCKMNELSKNHKNKLEFCCEIMKYDKKTYALEFPFSKKIKKDSEINDTDRLNLKTKENFELPSEEKSSPSNADKK